MLEYDIDLETLLRVATDCLEDAYDIVQGNLSTLPPMALDVLYTTPQSKMLLELSRAITAVQAVSKIQQ